MAGAYSDSRGYYYVQKNIETASEVALQLWKWSYSVLCPHKNTGGWDGACDYTVWINGDFEMIKRCDLLVVLPNYESSSGTKREIQCALDNDTLVYYWDNLADRFLLEKHLMKEKKFKVD